MFKKKIPGRGFGISGMIMGILAVVYGVVPFLNIITVDFSYNRINAQLHLTNLLMNMYPIIFAALALIFGVASRGRGYKSGQSTSAIVMGVISLAFCAITIVLSAFKLSAL